MPTVNCPGCGAPFHLTAVCPALEAVVGPPPIAGVPEAPGVSADAAIEYLRGRVAGTFSDIQRSSVPELKPGLPLGAPGGLDDAIFRGGEGVGAGTWAKGEDRECAACHQRLRSAPWTDPETRKRYEADTSCYTCGGKDMVPRR